jgi:hypothetical protein
MKLRYFIYIYTLKTRAEFKYLHQLSLKEPIILRLRRYEDSLLTMLTRHNYQQERKKKHSGKLHKLHPSPDRRKGWAGM